MELSYLHGSLKDTTGLLDKGAIIGALEARQTKASGETI